MKKLFAATAIMGVLALAACGSSGGGDDGGSGCSGGSGGGTDMTQMMVDNIKEASYWVTVHKDPKAGQYWETSSEAYGSKNTMRWQIAKIDGDIAIVEFQMKSKGEYSSYDYTTAYQVDLTKGMGEVNVQKAWIGKTGEKGKEIGVMAKPTGCGATGDKPTEEPFSGLEMAGGTWSGTIYTMKGDGWESKTWMAENGWFGGMIKSEASGMVTSLTAFGDDAKPLLLWE
ncbi:MAG: hypothetical protein KF696_12445 [Planctomycetes bacterium]|nr:hypothetical protein [Planctomycetota bacterium]MCW8136608.1 hypothetical protein [Planctomycetota bacterium]